MTIIRVRFKKDIVAEVGVPSARGQKRGKVLILCAGLPSAPSKKERIAFWTKKGYWTIHFRYRGTWESGGRFLKHSPHIDIRDILDALTGSKNTFAHSIECANVLRSIGDERRYKMSVKNIVIVGASFGGTAAILNSRDPRVHKVVTVSPVIDWRVKSKREPMPWFGRFVKEAFGEAYRFSAKDWRRLSQGKFYNPATELEKVDGKKIFIIHAKDDDVVPYKPSLKFVRATGATLLSLRRGGHYLDATHPSLYKKIARFLKL